MNVYIVDAKRTATGSFNGTLSNIHPAEYATEVVKTLIKDNNLDVNVIDELICGNTLSAGLKQNIARQIAIGAGIPEHICSYTLNMLCGSGIKTIMQGYAQISAGLADVIIAGGAESMSMAPYMDLNARKGTFLGHYEIKDHMVYDALTDAFSGVHMGVTAENVARKYNVTREMQDIFSYNSQVKASKAIKSGKFVDEIVPFDVVCDNKIITFKEDEYVDHDSSIEKLSALEPVFEENGTVTAGNASGINDGAAFVILASEKAVKQHNLKPLAKIVSFGQGGVDPQIMGMAPVEAIDITLKNCDVKFEDISIFELNEAFASQSIAVVEQLSLNYNVSKQYIYDRSNVNGGAIAIGHPVAASGARITTSLIYEMKRENHKYGLATLCVGGGMGVAILLENVEE